MRAMKTPLPTHKKLVHQTRMPVRWGDMDAVGHVNNAMYFRYMEDVRIEWMRAVGRDTAPPGQGAVIAHAFCNFLREIAYPAQLLLTLYVSDAARTTVETWITMEREDQPGVVLAEGGATLMWVDFTQHKAAPLPEWLRAAVA
ncbi:acyl-CoA thioester hydrolase [Oryzisolibacter propanilivorax]|uniref:Acyl-CoA thioester hydrolase n=2 Tax=Oryzisolibacter propanilivorax TaxID=1527607 RepID=A0A1G9P7S8_9BURK|nr:acyl-CoA thioester hydrolase [Oryzisolibacter propanilivorax]